MGAKIQAFDIFQTLLSSHYPLPLISKKAMLCTEQEWWTARELKIEYTVCSTTGNPTHSFATERVSLDSV